MYANKSRRSVSLYARSVNCKAVFMQDSARGRLSHVIFVLNLPVPDDRRVWHEAMAVRDAGRPVRVYCPAMKGHRAGRRVVDGIEVVYLRSFEGRGSIGVVLEGVWNTLLCLFHAFGFRASAVGSVQACNPPDSLFPVLALCRARGIRTIYDQHDVAPAMASMRPGLRRLRWLFDWCERLTVRASDVVVTSSQSQQTRLRERYDVEALLIRSATAPPQSLPRSGTDTCRLAYLGVIGAQEGLDDLLDAVDEIGGSVDGVAFELVVAGDGPYLAPLRERASAMGLDEIVRFPGWLSGDALAEFFPSVDAMVVADPPSEYNHHCAMNKVLDGMAHGIPVVMRPLRENLALTGDHRWVAAGWTVDDLASTIADFVRSTPAERDEEGARLSARYEANLQWTRQADAYVAAVDAAAATAGGDRT